MTTHLPGLDKSLVQRLEKKFRQREPIYYDTHPARTGQVDSAGVPLANPTEGLPQGMIWLRLSFDEGSTYSRAASPGIIAGVRSDIPDAPVWAGYTSPNLSGSLVAISVRASDETVSQYGAALAAVGVANTPPSVMNNPIPSALVQDGRVFAPPDSSLSLFVEAYPQSGWFGSTIAVDAGDLPTSPGEFGWLVVYLPPYSGTPVTPEYDVTVPRVRPNKDALLIADAVNLPLPAGSIRLFAVSVFNGQSGFTASNSTYFNLRRDFVPEGIQTGSTSLPDFGTQTIVTLSGGILDLTGIATRNIIVAAETGTSDTVDQVVGLTDGEGGIFQADSGDTITFANNSDIHLYNGVDLAIAGDSLLMLLGRGADVVTQPVDQEGSGSTLTSVTDFLTGSNLTLTTSGTYYDVASVSLTAGTWRVTPVCVGSVGTTATITLKVWDGTTVYGSTAGSGSAGFEIPLSTECEIVLGTTTTIKVSAKANANNQTILKDVGEGDNCSGILALKIA